MDIFILSKSQHICYNSSVPQKRDELIFDIGGRPIAPAAVVFSALKQRHPVWWA